MQSGVAQGQQKRGPVRGLHVQAVLRGRAEVDEPGRDPGDRLEDRQPVRRRRGRAGAGGDRDPGEDHQPEDIQHRLGVQRQEQDELQVTPPNSYVSSINYNIINI